jgi:electron transfer flavoprotein beta subunit
VVDVLVCIKRVPDVSGEITLTEDGRGVDDRYLGHTVSTHEECAIELAVQVANATGGSATVLSVGAAEAVEQLRDAVAVGCSAAVLVEAEAERYGPADVAAAIADVVRQKQADGTPYDLVLLGNDAADTGDFQVGVRLAYELGRPVLTGISTCEISGDTLHAEGAGPDGTEVFEVALPAVVAVQEGGVAPRYPSITGRMKAKRTTVETVAPTAEPAGSGRVRFTLPPPQPSTVQVLGEGPEAAAAVVDLLFELGVVSR